MAEVLLEELVGPDHPQVEVDADLDDALERGDRVDAEPLAGVALGLADAEDEQVDVVLGDDRLDRGREAERRAGASLAAGQAVVGEVDPADQLPAAQLEQLELSLERRGELRRADHGDADRQLRLEARGQTDPEAEHSQAASSGTTSSPGRAAPGSARPSQAADHAGEHRQARGRGRRRAASGAADSCPGRAPRSRRRRRPRRSAAAPSVDVTERDRAGDQRRGHLEAGEVERALRGQRAHPGASCRASAHMKPACTIGRQAPVT